MLLRRVTLNLTKSTRKYSAVQSVTLDVDKPFRIFNLKEGPSTKVTVTRDEAITLYTKMQSIRRLETVTNNLYKAKKVLGFCHLYVGQEAVAVGLNAIMRPLDTALTSYRCHAWTYLLQTEKPEVQKFVSILAELTGKRTGIARGKGGSMHMYTDRFYGGNAIVGAQVPMGVGLALASKYRGLEDKSVCFAAFGDGAANNGQVFEAYNIASLLKVPCVFLCENNIYSMGTSVHRSTADPEFYKRGSIVPGIWVDGMDVLAMREVGKFVIDWCSKGNGPITVEAETYRYYGHSLSDPGTSYRTRAEILLVRRTRGPIRTFRKKMVDLGVLTAAECKKIDDHIKKAVDEAAKIALADPIPDVEEVAADVYAESTVFPTIRHRSIFKPELRHLRIGKANNSK